MWRGQVMMRGLQMIIEGRANISTVIINPIKARVYCSNVTISSKLTTAL